MKVFNHDMIKGEFELMKQWKYENQLESMETEEECLRNYLTFMRNAYLRYDYISDIEPTDFSLDTLNVALIDKNGRKKKEANSFAHESKIIFFENITHALFSTTNSPFEKLNEVSNKIVISKTPYLYPCLTDPEKITDLSDFEYLSIFEFYFLIGVHLGLMLFTKKHSIGDHDDMNEFTIKMPLSHSIFHNLIFNTSPNIEIIMKKDNFKLPEYFLRENIGKFFIPVKKILKTLEIDPLKGINFLSKWFSFRETAADFTDLSTGKINEKLWSKYNVTNLNNTTSLEITKTSLDDDTYTDIEHVKKIKNYTTAFIEYYSCKYIHKYKIEGGDNSIPFKGSTASDEEIQLENKVLSEVLKMFAIQEYSAASPNGEATDPREFLYEVSKTVKDPTSVYNMYPVLDITMFNYLYRQSVLYLLRTDLDINLSKENYQNYYEDVDQTDEADPSSMRFSKKMFKYIKKEYSNPTAKELGDIRALLDLIKCIYLVRHKKQLFGKDVNTLQKCITTGFQQTLKLKFRYTPPKLTDNTDFKEFLKVKSLSKQNDDEILTLISDKIVPSVEIIKENVFKNRNLSPEKFDQYKKAIIAYLQPSEDDENPKKKIADFYKFVTGTSSTPLLIELNEITGGSDDLLPGSQTCFNTLYFYNYSTVDVFIQRLKVAISSTMIGGRNNNKIKINYKLK